MTAFGDVELMFRFHKKLQLVDSVVPLPRGQPFWGAFLAT